MSNLYRKVMESIIMMVQPMTVNMVYISNPHSFEEIHAVVFNFSKVLYQFWHRNLLFKLSAFGVGTFKLCCTERFKKVRCSHQSCFSLFLNLQFYSRICRWYLLHHSCKFIRVPKKEEVAEACKSTVLSTYFMDDALPCYMLDRVW